MQSNSVLIQNVTLEEFQTLLEKVLEDRISEIKKGFSAQTQTDVLLTREETCKFLKIDSSTLWSWTNKGKVRAYGIGSRRYYKKKELLENLKSL